jgi:hypothetical protein
MSNSEREHVLRADGAQVELLERLEVLPTIDRLKLLQIAIGQREVASLTTPVGKQTSDALERVGFHLLDDPRGHGRTLACASAAVSSYLEQRGSGLTLLEMGILSGVARTAALAMAGVVPARSAPYGRPTLAQYWLGGYYSVDSLEAEAALYDSQWVELAAASSVVTSQATAEYDAFISDWPTERPTAS